MSIFSFGQIIETKAGRRGVFIRHDDQHGFVICAFPQTNHLVALSHVDIDSVTGVEPKCHCDGMILKMAAIILQQRCDWAVSSTASLVREANILLKKDEPKPLTLLEAVEAYFNDPVAHKMVALKSAVCREKAKKA